MENLDRILRLYQAHPQISEIKALLEEGIIAQHRIEGSIGAHSSFLIAAHYLQNPKFQLIIGSNKEQAAYIFNNISSLLPKAPIYFLPDSFKKPYDFSQIKKDHLLQRTEVANKIRHEDGRAKIIVSYPEALFEKVVSPAILDENKIVITKDERLDLDFLNEVLLDYGFNRVDFVYEPGEYSIRGGIIDVFTYGNEWPYRIELFDEDIESIRVFDPNSQLSIRNISNVTIVPDIQSQIGKDHFTHVFQLFPTDTFIWIYDEEMLKDRLSEGSTKAEAFRPSLIINDYDDEVQQYFEKNMFVDPEVFWEAYLDRLQFHFRASKQASYSKFLVFNTTPQPSFNKNFSLLIEDLKEKQAINSEVFLFTDNPRQANRLQHIFEDLEATVIMEPVLIAINEGFIDHDLNMAAYTDHQIFQRYHKYKLRKGFDKGVALSMKFLKELQPGDFVTHIDHGVGRYSGLEKIDVNGRIQESVRIIYQNNDILYVSINALHKISKYVGKEGSEPRLNKLGSEKWKSIKSRTKKKVKDIAGELIKLYAKRKATQGFACEKDGYLQYELESSFFYEDTPDQNTATQQVKEDMEQSNPMDRLICGDVGFGKTEIAIRAAFKAVVNGKQVAILVPTTILALQHHKTFNDRLKDFGVDIDYVNRFRSSKEKNDIYKRLEKGSVDILIGTHAILNKKIKFKDLGLLVVDEEQKFGVAAKDKLKQMAVNVDTLTLTATPIPRTLQFSLMAARDLSILRTPPPNRQPIYTEIKVFDHALIKEAIYYEVERGGQIFFVHNRVKDLAEMEVLLKKLCPDIDISSAHGQMDPKRLEERLIGFIEGKYDVLLCTNIIETGLDIPNANTIIINNAHHFGLSDLHQLRGRVGRSNKKAFCYLFCPPLSALTSEARRRLKTIEEFSDLGGGFQIAMRDLDIRGAGNLLGGEQSGFMAEIGYDTYQKILEEAVQELKETDFQDLFQEELEKREQQVRDTVVETDTEMHIPDSYVDVIQERLNLYQELDNLKTEEELTAFESRMADRFGPLPTSVVDMMEGLRLRWLAQKLGFEHITLKSNVLRCYFVRDPQAGYYSTPFFQKLMAYLGKHGQKLGTSLKQSRNNLILIKSGINSLGESRQLLNSIYDGTREE